MDLDNILWLMNLNTSFKVLLVGGVVIELTTIMAHEMSSFHFSIEWHNSEFHAFVEVH
jgi:hypothetical protein